MATRLELARLDWQQAYRERLETENLYRIATLDKWDSEAKHEAWGIAQDNYFKAVEIEQELFEQYRLASCFRKEADSRKVI